MIQAILCWLHTMYNLRIFMIVYDYSFSKEDEVMERVWKMKTSSQHPFKNFNFFGKMLSEGF